MRLTMKLFISGLAFVINLGLAVLAAPVDVDPVPSKYHLEFDRSPDPEWALERRVVNKKRPVVEILPKIKEEPATGAKVVVTVQAPTPVELSKKKATGADFQKIVTDIQHLFGFALEGLLGVSENVEVEVHSAKPLKYVPKPNVKLLFTAEVHGGSKDGCGGICRGSMMSDSNHGWIDDSKGHRIYGSI